MSRSDPRPDRSERRSGPRARLLLSRSPWHGPSPVLPGALDRAVDRWYGMPPRVRAGVLVAGVVALLLLAGAGAARSPWGPPVPVLVTTVDVPPGEGLSADHVRTERRPAGLVPEDAVRDLVGLPEPRAAGLLLAGTVLTGRHLAGVDPATAGLADGRAAFPVDAAALPPLRVGQRLDVVAGDLEGHGRVLARDARVRSIVDGVVWLDVARDDAPAIAAAALRDGLRVVLLGP
ncbi:MAG: SAF domain-containing protein [Actinobacteria bacterium]|nr:SAF domain-containing protein [Actinomycetota bacterium]